MVVLLALAAGAAVAGEGRSAVADVALALLALDIIRYVGRVSYTLESEKQAIFALCTMAVPQFLQLILPLEPQPCEATKSRRWIVGQIVARHVMTEFHLG